VLQHKALFAAFSLLDVSDDGKLSMSEFRALIEYMHPKMSRDMQEITFGLIDADKSAFIELDEFMGSIEVLLKPVKGDSDDSRCCNSFSRNQFCYRIVTRPAFEAVSTFIIVAYTGVLIATMVKTTAWLTAIDHAFLVLFTAECVLKVAGLSWTIYWSDTWNRLDFVLVVLALVTLVVDQILKAATSDDGGASVNVTFLRTLRVLKALRFIRIGRLLNMSSRKTKVLMTTIGHFSIILLPAFIVLLVFMIVYAVIGMESLHGALSPNHSPLFSNCSPYCPSFDTIWNAEITLFQMLMGTNFLLVWREAAAAVGFVWPTLYMMSYLLICHVFTLSLVAALVFQVYTVEMDRAVRNEKLEDPLEAILKGEGEVVDDEVMAKKSKYHVVLTSSVKEQFDKYDADHTGSIDIDELRNLLRELTSGELVSEEDVQTAMVELDCSGDQLIDYTEFLPWWRRHGIRRVFLKHDADKSGKISLDELGPMMVELGIKLQPDEVAEALESLDIDGDGTVGLDEYLKWFTLYDVQNDFAKFDEDGSGSISRREFFRLTLNHGVMMSRKELDRVFTTLDKDKGGSISFAEFYPWWSHVRDKQPSQLSVNNWEESLFLERESLRKQLQEVTERFLTGLPETLESSRDALVEQWHVFLQESASPEKRERKRSAADFAVGSVASFFTFGAMQQLPIAAPADAAPDSPRLSPVHKLNPVPSPARIARVSSSPSLASTPREQQLARPPARTVEEPIIEDM